MKTKKKASINMKTLEALIIDMENDSSWDYEEIEGNFQINFYHDMEGNSYETPNTYVKLTPQEFEEICKIWYRKTGQSIPQMGLQEYGFGRGDMPLDIAGDDELSGE